MSHSRIDDVIVFDCDAKGCHANFETDIGDFRASWAQAQAYGWKALNQYQRSISTWNHYCPSCVKKMGD